MSTMTRTAHDAIQAQIDRIEDAIDREELKSHPDERAIANGHAAIESLKARQQLIASR